MRGNKFTTPGLRIRAGFQNFKMFVHGLEKIKNFFFIKRISFELAITPYIRKTSRIIVKKLIPR
jgi:hypothetical protein